MPTYRLIEIDASGRRHIEEFKAPDDETAVARIVGETRGLRYQLWCGDDLVDEGVPRFRGH